MEPYSLGVHKGNRDDVSFPEHSTLWDAGKCETEGNCQGCRNKENPLVGAAKRKKYMTCWCYLCRIILLQSTSDSFFQWPTVLRENSMHAVTWFKQLTASKMSGFWLKWVVILQSRSCWTWIHWLHVGSRDFTLRRTSFKSTCNYCPCGDICGLVVSQNSQNVLN